MFRPVQMMAIACLTMAMPLAALAEKTAHAGGGAKSAKAQKQPAPQQAKARAAQTRPAPVAKLPVPAERVVRVGGPKPCPPGLAKKDPACVPPGQAKKNAYDVGETVDWNLVHIVRRPGLYGVTDPPAGQRYAIVDGRLVRVDDTTGRILSILRVVEAILD